MKRLRNYIKIGEDMEVGVLSRGACKLQWHGLEFSAVLWREEARQLHDWLVWVLHTRDLVLPRPGPHKNRKEIR